MAGTALTIPGKIHKSGLALPMKMSFEDWEKTGTLLTQISASSRWWVGDWLNHGEEVFGEKYSQALDALEYQKGTLKNAAWVTKEIELERRHDALSFSHHMLVAPCEPKEQDQWLAKAEKEEWTVNDLRQQMMTANPGKNPPHTFIEGEEFRVRGKTWSVEKISEGGQRMVIREIAF